MSDKCEVCGSQGPSIVLARVRTTNGGLLWCEQCRDDINRKNPRVAELANEVKAFDKSLVAEMAKNRSLERELAAALEEIAVLNAWDTQCEICDDDSGRGGDCECHPALTKIRDLQAQLQVLEGQPRIFEQENERLTAALAEQRRLNAELVAVCKRLRPCGACFNWESDFDKSCGDGCDCACHELEAAMELELLSRKAEGK